MEPSINKTTSYDDEEEDNPEYDEDDEEEEDYKGVLEDEASSEDLGESITESSIVLIEVGLHRPILKSRKGVAEILPYNLNYVQSLHEMSLKAIAASFSTDPIDLNLLTTEEQYYIIQHLSCDLPLSIVAGRIEAEGYWKNRSENYFGTEAFKMVDMAEYGDSYRRLFFETYLQNRICNFVPHSDDFTKLLQDVSVGGKFVVRLTLDQLMIPVIKLGTGEEQVQYDEQGRKAEYDYNHLDLETLGEYFTDLEELSIRYGVNNCGLNFDWTMFHCTTKDCQSLCGMMKKATSLRSLRISHSRINDSKIFILTTNLASWCFLNALCLAHNNIADDGARLIGKFLRDDTSLTFLDLCDNRIHSEGGMAIAQGLKSNKSLKRLNLRLNLLGHGAIRMFSIALRFNLILENLNLSANLLDDACCAILARGMKDFQALSTLSLSANSRITMEGIKNLLRGIQYNETITKLKLKGLPFNPDFAACFTEKLNLNNAKKQPMERSVIMTPSVERG